MNTASGSALLLIGAKLIDGTGTQPVIGVDIAVEGDRICSVTSSGPPSDGTAGAGVGSATQGEWER